MPFRSEAFIFRQTDEYTGNKKEMDMCDLQSRGIGERKHVYAMVTA